MAVEHPPAIAYYEVATILGDEYFNTPPPRSGRRVEVTGIDGLTTVWEVTCGAAERLLGAIGRRRDLMARSTPFDRGNFDELP